MAKAFIQEDNLTDIVHKQVVSAFREVLSDPDFGLELTKGITLRLNSSARSKKAGQLKSLSEILDKYKSSDVYA